MGGLAYRSDKKRLYVNSAEVGDLYAVPSTIDVGFDAPISLRSGVPIEVESVVLGLHLRRSVDHPDVIGADEARNGKGEFLSTSRSACLYPIAKPLTVTRPHFEVNVVCRAVEQGEREVQDAE